MVLYNNKLVAEFDIEATIPDSWDCKDSKYCYQHVRHIVTGDLKIITDSRIWSIICKGPKCRFPSLIDFTKCHEEIVGALQEFCNRLCKREHVESIALNTWKLNIFIIFIMKFLFIAII